MASIRRFRRLRANTAIRELVQETRLLPEQLVLPIFVHDERTIREIPALPGHSRMSIPDAAAYIQDCVGLGIRAFALFPAVSQAAKDFQGSEALNREGLIYRALKFIRGQVPEALLIADVALDPYTTHGHDGVLDMKTRDVDNDATVAVLEKMAVYLAAAGAHFVAPSDMMDGRVLSIRTALDVNGFPNVGIISYAAKFASSFYGPFRNAVGSAGGSGNAIDKRTYQINPANLREALRECKQDEAEGADILLVKPAGLYLDVIHALRQNTTLPIAAFQVSGEYSAICAAADQGWLDKGHAALESLLCIRRAGADFIFTYFAREAAILLRG